MPYTPQAVDSSVFIEQPRADPYLQSLQALSLQAGPRGILSGAAMRGRSQPQSNNVDGYLAALAAQADAGIRAQQAADAADIAKTGLTTLAANVHAGVGGAVQFNDNSYYTVDQGYIQGADKVAQEKARAAAFGDRAKGLGDVAATGYMPNPAQTGDILTGLSNVTDIDVAPYMTPKDRNDQTTANAAVTRANASMVAANRPQSSGGSNDDGVTISKTYGGTGGMPATTVRGTQAEIDAYELENPPSAYGLPLAAGPVTPPRGADRITKQDKDFVYFTRKDRSGKDVQYRRDKRTGREFYIPPKS